ncbi:ClpXP protease specificity-enhancing factor [Hahella sp. SMD15-11]|uniref:ClpXP protease specificity-enhancing factor n=2 Tax=Thermohahella caldifontis TaxID=3142973 RepID=A0AB39UWS7_9GAMM
MPDRPMTSSRPYLIRALNEWILDNGLTPYLVVDAGCTGVDVPSDYVSAGQIVLNISPGAVRGLTLGNEWIEFSARFGGVPTAVRVPVRAVLAVYARENGQGMVFGAEPGFHPDPDDTPPSDEPPKAPGSGKPHLKVVK